MIPRRRRKPRNARTPPARSSRRLQRDPTLSLFVWEVVLDRRRRASASSACRAARPPPRSLPVHARGALRDRPRPDRLQRARGRDERTTRDLLTFSSYDEVAHHSVSSARTRSKAPQARPPVRPHRLGPPVRAKSVPDHRPSDRGQRRARRSSSATATASTILRGAVGTSDVTVSVADGDGTGRLSAQRSTRQREGRRRAGRRRRTSPARAPSSLLRATSG
jgi:hypothetical protein